MDATARNPEFSVRAADWARDAASLREIRHRVFVVEQGVPEALEWDEIDTHCRHILAESATRIAIGTARVTPANQIGRMAVEKDWRGRGVGAALLGAALRACAVQADSEPFLHAQVTAIEFYRQLGFVAVGKIYEEAGIAHQTMRYLSATTRLER